MKVLVTGGAGYIGSTVLPILLERKDWDVTVIDSLVYGIQPILPLFKYKNFTFIKGDIRDEALMQEQLPKYDVIIHLAALVGYPLCKQKPREAEEVNLNAVEFMSGILQENQKVIYASTGSNYGDVPPGEICTEETPLRPSTLYGVTKTKAEECLLKNNNAVGLRYATAFGIAPRLRLDLLVNDFVFQALKNKTLVLFERSFMRTFIHVRDIARSIVFAIDHYDQMKGEAFNVGSNDLNYSKEDLANMIKEKIDFYLHFAEIGTDEDRRNYAVSYEKISKLGFKCEISIEEGIDELIAVLAAVDPKSYQANLLAAYNA